MADVVPDNGKEPVPTAIITLGQIIGMQFKSSRRESALKRTTQRQRSANQAISEPMTIDMVRQRAGAGLTLADGRLSGGGVAMSLLSGID